MTRRVVLMVLDGLRRDQIHPDVMPVLGGFLAQAAVYPRHRSVFPSCTRVVSSSIATGCLPGRHGIQGNTLALLEDGRPRLHDVGLPGFFGYRRAISGRAMDRATLAERLAGKGGAIVFSNVSPGAAYAQDPDGHGWVYHRAGSFGPGLQVIEPLDAVAGLEGDDAMVGRFCSEILESRRPALAVLWCGEPDTAQHRLPLGGPEHLDVLRGVDRNVASVLEAIDGDEDTLMIVASDHGHETVTGAVDVVAALVTTGLKADADSDDLVVAANGSAVLIYARPDAVDRLPALDAFLREQPWAGKVTDAAQLATIGLAPLDGLVCAVSLAADEEPNAFGVPGRTLVAAAGGQTRLLGYGQHGGLGTYAQAPFLAVRGGGLHSGTPTDRATSAIDIAPTVLRHLDLPGGDEMDGAALQDSFHRCTGVANRD